MKKISLDKFDILGFFELKNNVGIEELTTPLSSGEYLSRNMLYYSLSNCIECSRYREYCKSLLDDVHDNEKKFVIFEHMLTASARVFYSQIQRKTKGEDNFYDLAKECFEQDCLNLINVMSGNQTNKNSIVLPDIDEPVELRQIELDNKALLALFTSNLELEENDKVLLTGLGGLYLGAFCKILYGCEYAIAPLSSYAGNKDLLENPNLDLRKYLSEPQILDANDPIVFLDDNMGTGATMKKIVELLKRQGKDCKCGAVQYNWINYNKVETGEKDIDRFSISEIDYLTQFNYPGNKLLKHAIEKYLVNSGDEYVNYIKRKGYRDDEESDLAALARKGEKFANRAGVYFDIAHEQEGEAKRLKPCAHDFIKKIDKSLGIVKKK